MTTTAHSMFDAQLYRQKEEIEAWRVKGPIVRFEAWLREIGVLHETDRTRIDEAIEAEIDGPAPRPKAGPWSPSRSSRASSPPTSAPRRRLRPRTSRRRPSRPPIARRSSRASATRSHATRGSS
ncbi:thiamine pyrophosphate-dependent enzyme [Salinarimonas sp. NSM]|uniref:thiamine pyrophosphate-dependent enzyme n=1 Tax=Salinarimonas sp. NSM TaxID=3458003 RepID=UPI004036FD04